MKKGGNRKEAIEKLTELIKVSPQNEEYIWTSLTCIYRKETGKLL